MIVVLILGILGAVAIGRVTNSFNDAELAALQENRDAIYDAIDLNSSGAPPPAILGEWFRSGKPPFHPQASGSRDTFQTVNSAGVMHPANKVIDGSIKPYWYNSANGVVRVRVAVVGSPTETLDFYNVINDSSATDLGNYGGGGGGSGS
jgi:type II secretory pathway pseudopilin PulG